MSKEKKEIQSKNIAIKYNDSGIRIVLSVLAAHVMTAYNEPEGLFEVILTPSYLRGFIASFVIALLIIQLIYFITVKLNKTYIWHEQPLLRFLWQVLLGFLTPAVAVFLLVALFFRIYSINVFHTEYISQDYPLVLLMLLCINLYYFGLHYFLLTAKHTEEPPLEATVPPNVESVTTDMKPAPEKEIPMVEPPYKETLIITTPLKTFPVRTDDIAYIYRLSDSVFIRLTSMDNSNESYQTNYSLKDLEEMLDPNKFFRINRQMIVHYQSVSAFRTETPKTLFLTLNPPPYLTDKDIPVEHQKLCIVSESRTPRFKLWMNR